MSGADVEIVIGAEDKASKVLDNVAKKAASFSTSFATLGPIAAGVGAGIASVTAAFSALNGVISSVAESANKIDALTDTANGLGESVGSLQAFQFAMSEAGNVDAEKSIQALQKMQKVVGEVASGGDSKVFDKLGLDANALSLKGPIDQFLAVKAAVGSIENVSERAAIAQQLLGKSAADLIPALIAEQSGFEDSMRAAQALGVTVSDEGATAIANMNDAVGRLMSGFEGIANQVAVAIAPLVESIATELATWVPPAVTIAKEVLPSVVDILVQVAGYAADVSGVFGRLAAYDFTGALNAAQNMQTADDWANRLEESRKAAYAQSIADEEKRKSIAMATLAVDEKAIEAEAKRGQKVLDTIASLERKLQVAMLGEDLVKQQEELALATNDAERERIALLQEQISAQEQQNELVKKMEAEAKKNLDEVAKDQEKADKEAADKAGKLASASTGTQAVESRLLTRGRSEQGIDKIAKNTQDSAAALRRIDANIAKQETSSKKLELELVG